MIMVKFCQRLKEIQENEARKKNVPGQGRISMQCKKRKVDEYHPYEESMRYGKKIKVNMPEDSENSYKQVYSKRKEDYESKRRSEKFFTSFTVKAMPISWLSRSHEAPSQERVEKIKMNPENLTHYSVNNITDNDVGDQSEEKKEQGYLNRLFYSSPTSSKNSNASMIQRQRRPTPFVHKSFAPLENIGEESKNQNSSHYSRGKVAESSGYLTSNGSTLGEPNDSHNRDFLLNQTRMIAGNIFETLNELKPTLFQNIPSDVITIVDGIFAKNQ